MSECIQVVSNVLLVVATCVYAFLTYKILRANKRSVDVARESLEEQRQQHLQNLGVQLYPYRERAISDIESNRLDGSLVGARILFGARVGGLVSEFESAEEERVLAQRRVDYCIKCIEEVNPEAYSRYRGLRDIQSLQRPSDWAKTGKEIDRILGDVSYEALVSEGSRPRMATYGELKEELDAASRIAKDARLRLVEAMRDEVKADIGI